MNIRRLHLYLGTFFAPAILFFTLTGALQTFGLHENKNGAQNPAWIAKLAAIHKEQHLAGEAPREPPARERRAQSEPREEREESGPSPLPLKIFVLLMSIGLIVTTLLGLTMAFQYNSRRVVWAMLAAGTILPIILLYL